MQDSEIEKTIRDITTVCSKENIERFDLREAEKDALRVILPLIEELDRQRQTYRTMYEGEVKRMERYRDIASFNSFRIFD